MAYFLGIIVSQSNSGIYTMGMDLPRLAERDNPGDIVGRSLTLNLRIRNQTGSIKTGEFGITKIGYNCFERVKETS